MKENDLKILDCTLRDGGYVNGWNWKFCNASAIIRYLTKAKVDFVEVGFLRNKDGYDPDNTVCNTIEELNNLLPEKVGNTIYSAMVMRSNYDIRKLSYYSGKGIEMIRVTAHDIDIQQGMDFAKEVKNRGYKLSINPINIMGYTDEQLLWILDQVNHIQPYQFSIVDTFGSMKRRDLDRIASIVDNNLDRNIRVALHLHENMSLSFCLAQQFIDKHMNRPLAIDGSLYGMGRIPGNLPIELLADYLNDYADKEYDIDYMMDAIQEYIEPIKGKSEWGYTPAYFLSARYNLHRNYAEHYLMKGDLSHRDINHILAGFDKSKATIFDPAYADLKYNEYKNNSIDDRTARNKLKCLFKGHNILLIAPGYSIISCEKKILAYITDHKPIVIAINFIPERFVCDFAFFSNGRRYSQVSDVNCQIIVTSNIEANREAYQLDYNSLANSYSRGYNSYVMFLKFLCDIGVQEVSVAGADGYQGERENYCNSSLHNNMKYDNEYNSSVERAVRKLGIKVTYITESAYNCEQ